MTTNTRREALNAFLADKERRALSMAEYAVGNRDDALDIVQDAMIRFATRYVSKPQEQWPPLFYRVLQSRIQDFFRKASVKNKYFGWLPGMGKDNMDEPYNDDPIQQVADAEAIDVSRLLDSDASTATINQAIQQLPMRQQQAFLLRCWEGLDTRTTAQAMQCSEGSVKTHYSRALNQLKKSLQSTYNNLYDHATANGASLSEQSDERETA